MIKVKEKIILDKEHQKIINTLHKKIELLEKDNKEMANVEKQHKYMNGEMYKEIDKLKKENEQLKKENQIIREGNDYLGIYSTKLIDEVKKLNDDMTETIKVAEPLVKKNNRNIMFMTSIQGLIRYNTRLNEIYKKLKKN
jgi:septal ring factor EnvC (AmiA/AmiB activator)